MNSSPSMGEASLPAMLFGGERVKHNEIKAHASCQDVEKALDRR
jgi:hypothetical protein